jgi:hypothetical protein
MVHREPTTQKPNRNRRQSSARNDGLETSATCWSRDALVAPGLRPESGPSPIVSLRRRPPLRIGAATPSSRRLCGPGAVSSSARFAPTFGNSGVASSEAATDLLRLCFVQVVERIFERHSPHIAEPGLFAKLANLRIVKTERAEPCSIVRERSGHAVEHTYTVKHCA